VVAPRTRSRAVAASGAARATAGISIMTPVRATTLPPSWARNQPASSAVAHPGPSLSVLVLPAAQPAAGAVVDGTAAGSASAGARRPMDLATITQAAVTRTPTSSAAT
jgi:hypothetical protein